MSDYRLDEIYQARLSHRIAQEIEALAAGQAKDYADYRARCGRINGLRVASQEHREAIRQLHTEEE